MPSVFATSNIFRNVQVSNKLRVAGRSERFVQICQQLLKQRFKKVAINKKVSLGHRSTDVDIVVPNGKMLYLFECKYSVHPCDPHELRDIWNDILKGVQQLKLAKEILTNPKLRQIYLSGWFSGIRRSDTDNLVIKACILSPIRLFAGMTFEDVAIRDIQSLALIIGENEISVSTPENENYYTVIKYSLTEESGFSVEHFNDYLGQSSTYFRMFHENMFPVSRTWELVDGKIILSRETFVFQFDIEEWPKQMDRLGFRRIPDERRKIKPLLKKEDLMEILEKERPSFEIET